jgi:isopentenyl-diphosphate delta-isomerase
MPITKSEIEKRKSEHMEFVLSRNAQARNKSTGFEDIDFIHNALTELNLNKIKISCKMFGKELKAPLVIEAITGGFSRAREINRGLAKAANEFGIAMGVGSQRPMLEMPEQASTYQVRDVAPNILLIGNIGIVQLKKYGVEKIEKAVSKIQADALAVHLNPQQEAVQKNGDRNFERCLGALEKLTSEISVPVIVKETGGGISRSVALKLEHAGVEAIDVGGAGGTTWVGVEALRKKDKRDELFWDWGIPTALSVAEVAHFVGIPVIASGGVRNGIDAAKGIALGASYAGAAFPFLKALEENGTSGVKSEIERWINELKICMLLTGSKDLHELKRAQILITGRTAELFKLRKIDVEKFANR